ncbi:hypothetical protein HERIO_1767 [Hepatospora eriocheir]|uniref:Uncharacterized protein n=1 Tax=Hepatospora eriocheir TaxID=1081669 RepID=A0A1X0Q9D7_9MICR|nr:hypothetical protein HERIO_1767 [Hepatospora eriocheir]
MFLIIYITSLIRKLLIFQLLNCLTIKKSNLFLSNLSLKEFFLKTTSFSFKWPVILINVSFI